jgi:hypothetical protein
MAKNFFNMPAGKEMDILIGESVMGWHLIPDEYIDDEFEGIKHWAQMWLDKDNRLMCNSFQPSTNISDAWEVVRKMRNERYWFYSGALSSYCFVSFENIEDRITYTSRAKIDEIPLAICRAALLKTENKK